ncbi:MAG: NAD(P)H-binding protein [Rhodoblastus sp.]
MNGLLVIAGATGLVGTAAVDEALRRGWRVAALVRNPGKIRPCDNLEAIATNFDDLPALAAGLTSRAPKAFLCALGTTIRTAGSREAFARVDRDYVAAFAQLGAGAGAARFALVSSAGADPASSNFYLRVKGEAEAAVRAAGFAHIEIAWPGLLTGKREEHRIGEKIAAPVLAAFAPLMVGGLAKYRPIEAAIVARALVHALEKPESGLFYRYYPQLRALART